MSHLTLGNWNLRPGLPGPEEAGERRAGDPADGARGEIPDHHALPGPMKTVTPGEDAKLREILKRCSATTYIAAREFRRTGDLEHLPTILRGIVERCVQHDRRARLAEADDSLRLAEELGIDSLTMMEIVALTEDVLQISIETEDLRRLDTLGELRQFIACRLGEPAGPGSRDERKDPG